MKRFGDIAFFGVVPKGVLRADRHSGQAIQRLPNPFVIALAGAGAHDAQQLGYGEADGARSEMVVSKQLHQRHVDFVIGCGGQAKLVAACDEPFLANGTSRFIPAFLNDFYRFLLCGNRAGKDSEGEVR